MLSSCLVIFILSEIHVFVTFLTEKSNSSCLYLQVKRVMNGVFHSLRREFDLSESYSGEAVLAVIVSTIKVSAFYRKKV